MLAELVRSCRTVRRFKNEIAIPRSEVLDCLDTARLCASGSNRQPLKYWVSAERQTNDRIFPCLGWAGYLTDWSGPAPEERPAAYVIVLGDRTIAEDFGVDPGLAMQTMLLAAREKGYGGCVVASIRRTELREALDIPPHLDVLFVVALGVPDEKVVIDAARPGESVKYYRDTSGVHHVPKRSLQEIVVN